MLIVLALDPDAVRPAELGHVVRNIRAMPHGRRPPPASSQHTLHPPPIISIHPELNASGGASMKILAWVKRCPAGNNSCKREVPQWKDYLAASP